MKTKLTRILSLALATIMCLSTFALTSCSKKEEKFVVGVCQLVAHEALDAATEGFIQALKDELGEENVEFIVQNGAGSPDTCATIANTFVSQNVDLIMANATPALQAVANATLTIPVLGTSVTEYGTALEIDNFSGTVGGNISGTSDLAPLDQQAKMIKDLFPSAQKVGILFCSSEVNSVYQVKVVKEELAKMGLTAVEYSFADSNDVAMIAQKAAAECDVLYIPTDNTAASCAETIYGAMTTPKPIICGEEGSCKGCGVATLSINYYDLGYTTGKMAAKILKGEADISTMPIQYADIFTKKYNPVICEALGITPPADFEAIALD